MSVLRDNREESINNGKKPTMDVQWTGSDLGGKTEQRKSR